MGLGKPAVLCAAFLSASSAFGAISACAGAAAGNTLASYGASSLTDGCAVVDLSNSLFSITGASSTGGGTTPSTSNMDIWATGTAASGNTVGPVTANFDGVGSLTTGSAAEAGTINYVATANTGGSYTGGTYPSPTTPGLKWDFTSFTLTPTDTISGSGGTQDITVTSTFCLGATTTTGCATAETGVITATMTLAAPTPTYACTFDGASCGTTNTISFSATLGVTEIAVSDAFTLTRTSGSGATVDLTNLANTFDEGTHSSVPEPSTFILMGSALVAFAGVRRFRMPARPR